jgi:molybdate transport system substrate-binding protein
MEFLVKRRWIVAATIGLGLGLAACRKDAETPSPSKAPVTVFAAASLKELVTELANDWATRTGAPPPRLQFDATSTLARQLGEGAPADLFLTAAPEWLEKVKTVERVDWLSNHLVLVVPKESPDVKLDALTSLALANEQVPAGKYARAAFAKLGVKLPERLILGESVRDVLSKVSEGGAQAGVVYATDAAIDPKVRVASTFPADSHPKIVYSIGVLTAAGQALGAALREKSALEVAKKHGFETP